MGHNMILNTVGQDKHLQLEIARMKNNIIQLYSCKLQMV